MPARPRMDMAAHHHIINDEVYRMNIFRYLGLSKSVISMINKSDKSGD